MTVRLYEIVSNQCGLSGEEKAIFFINSCTGQRELSARNVPDYAMHD